LLSEGWTRSSNHPGEPTARWAHRPTGRSRTLQRLGYRAHRLKAHAAVGAASGPLSPRPAAAAVSRPWAWLPPQALPRWEPQRRRAETHPGSVRVTRRVVFGVRVARQITCRSTVGLPTRVKAMGIAASRDVIRQRPTERAARFPFQFVFSFPFCVTPYCRGVAGSGRTQMRPRKDKAHLAAVMFPVSPLAASN
jgi:hypothetical protein